MELKSIFLTNLFQWRFTHNASTKQCRQGRHLPFYMPKQVSGIAQINFKINIPGIVIRGCKHACDAKFVGAFKLQAIKMGCQRANCISYRPNIYIRFQTLIDFHGQESLYLIELFCTSFTLLNDLLSPILLLEGDTKTIIQQSRHQQY